jgi:ATP-dependent DNA helicase RecG
VTITLATPLEQVLGAKTSELLESQLDLRTIEDLLRHYPRRYDRRGALTDLGSVNVGDHVTIQGEVRSFTTMRNASRPGTRQEVVVSDGTGTLSLMFFNQPWREKDLAKGRRGMFSGQIGMYRGKRQLSHPEYEMLEDEQGVPDTAYLDEFIAVYGATAKVQSWTLARCVSSVLDKLGDVPDLIDAAMRTQRGLPTLREALQWIHKPTTDEQLELARERLKWDEALALQTVLAQQRYEE